MTVPLKKYMVIVDGQGELGHDFSVIVRQAHTPREALDLVLEDGYGQDDDGEAHVVELSLVSTFTINESRKKQAKPSNWGAILERTPDKLQHFREPDNPDYPQKGWNE